METWQHHLQEQEERHGFPLYQNAHDILFVINREEKVVLSGLIRFFMFQTREWILVQTFTFVFESIREAEVILYLSFFLFEFVTRKLKNIFTLKFQKSVFSMQEGSMSH